MYDKNRAVLDGFGNDLIHRVQVEDFAGATGEKMKGLVCVVDERRLGPETVLVAVAAAAAAALDDSLTSPKIFPKDEQRRAEQSRHRHQPTARESEGCNAKNRAVMDGFGYAHRLQFGCCRANSYNRKNLAVTVHDSLHKCMPL